VEDQAEVISSGSLIPLRIFDLIGFFNEDIFIYYVDTDFCMRVTRHGLRVYLCTDAVMLHREGLKSYRRFLWWETPYTHYGRIARYYLTRNLVYMLSNHSLPPGYALGLLRSNWEDHMKILLFDAQRFRILWFSLRGLIDGLRGKVGPISFGF
jgi:rhamnosyltransferase